VTLDYKNAYLLKIKSETALLFQATVGPMLPLPKRMDLDSPTIDPLVKQSINELCPAVIEKESAKVFRRRNEGYVTRLNIENLKEYVSTSSTDRARICLHDQDDSPLHEMFMVFDKSNFIKPAFHPKKDESILVLEGLVTILIFDSSGKIVSTIPLGDYNNSANRSCVFRVKQGEIHTLLVESDYAVLKETTQGPFRDNHTVFPNWDDNAKTKFDNFIHSNYRLS
jgi:cupin fold WbuC family metalloprotein